MFYILFIFLWPNSANPFNYQLFIRICSFPVFITGSSGCVTRSSYCLTTRKTVHVQVWCLTKVPRLHATYVRQSILLLCKFIPLFMELHISRRNLAYHQDTIYSILSFWKNWRGRFDIAFTVHRSILEWFKGEHPIALPGSINDWVSGCASKWSMCGRSSPSTLSGFIAIQRNSHLLGVNN
mgnify:CR=1 FL=1